MSYLLVGAFRLRKPVDVSINLKQTFLGRPNYRFSVIAVGRKHPVEAGEIDPRFRHLRCKPGNEVQWPEDGFASSRDGVFSWYRTLPLGVSDRRFSEKAGRLIYLHNRSTLWH